MILQRVLMTVAAAAAIAAAVAIALIALAFAIFAFLRPYVGPANASAIVAAAFAVIVGLIGFLAAQRAGGGFGQAAQASDGDAMSLAERLMDLARERPVIAVGVALALGVVLMRSPRSLAAVARAFFETLSGRSEA